jgi:hypothetical protein
MEFKKLNDLKEKLRQKKGTASEWPKDQERMPSQNKLGEENEQDKSRKRGQRTTSGLTQSDDLTEKLKAAFHEKPPEDKELERKKELDRTVRDFRKSFREDVRTGVRQEVKQISQGVAVGVKTLSEGVATEVKQTITNIKDATKTKKKEIDDEEQAE